MAKNHYSESETSRLDCNSYVYDMTDIITVEIVCENNDKLVFLSNFTKSWCENNCKSKFFIYKFETKDIYDLFMNGGNYTVKSLKILVDFEDKSEATLFKLFL